MPWRWLGFGAAALGLLVLALAIALRTPDRPRAALEARYAAPPSRFLEILGLRIHLRESGPAEAPAVILLHGFGSSLHTWEDWARGLDPAFRVIRIDLPGFGLTGPDPTGDYSDGRAHALLIALMDRLAIPRAHFVGSSMGGRIAWGFAARHPERVDRLVLLAPDGFASPGQGYGAAPRVHPLARLLTWTLPDRILRGGLAPAYADPATLTDALFERYRDMLLAPGVRGAILDRIAGHVLEPPEPWLARITAPTLLLWGERDAMVPLANAQDYLGVLRDARLVSLPGVGHVPMEEAPAKSLAPVRAFLAGG